MIDKNEFYSEGDFPSEKDRVMIRQGLLKGFSAERNNKTIFGINTFGIRDLRSFYLGMAASVVAVFFLIGVYATIRHLAYEMKPGEVKLAGAYQSAIHELEKVVPAAINMQQASNPDKDYIRVKKEQLQGIDQAIYELRMETVNNDLSPIKQMKLRELYITKLKILQEIVEQGEVRL